MPKRYLFCVSCPAVLLLAAHVLGAGFVLKPVVLEGDPATAIGQGATFHRQDVIPVTPFGNARLAPGGSLTFDAYVYGPDSTQSRGIWSSTFGEPEPIALNGGDAVGVGPDVTWGVGSYFEPNADGRLAFVAGLSGPGIVTANNSGLWTGVPGDISLIARAGDHAPAAVGDVAFRGVSQGFNGMKPGPVNDAGDVAFYTPLGGADVTANDAFGLYASEGGVVRKVVRTGEHAPGTPDGWAFFGNSLFTNPFVERPFIDPSGHVALRANLENETGTHAGEGIWAERSGGLTLMARTGGDAPDTAPGVTFSALSDFVAGRAGHLATVGALQGPGVTTSNNQGLWLAAPDGGMQLVARRAETLPGLNPSLTLSSIVTQPTLNTTGDLAFDGSLRDESTGIRHRGIVREVGGIFDLIELEGRHAPGAPAGVSFTGSTAQGPTISDSGLVAFVGILEGAGVTSDNDQGCWVADGAGQLLPVLREGASLEVRPGDFRTVMGIQLRGGFDDADHIALWLAFTDLTSGLFVAQIPAPGSVAFLLTAAGGGLLARRRRTGSSARERSSEAANHFPEMRDYGAHGAVEVRERFGVTVG